MVSLSSSKDSCSVVEKEVRSSTCSFLCSAGQPNMEQANNFVVPTGSAHQERLDAFET